MGTWEWFELTTQTEATAASQRGAGNFLLQTGFPFSNITLTRMKYSREVQQYLGREKGTFALSAKWTSI